MSSILRRLQAFAAVLFVLLLAGCATVDENIAMTEDAVVPITVGEAAEVTAYELAEAMLRAGFTPEQILEHGPAVRNALATSGGVQVRDGKFVAAIFSAHAGELYVTSRTRGTFSQPLGLQDGARAVIRREAPG